MKEVIRSVLSALGYRVEGIRYTPRQLLDPNRRRELRFDDVICRHMFEHGQECIFIQVGAYDGISTDPLYKYVGRCGWRGVLLEPQPRSAASLRQLYQDNDKIAVLEAALDRQRGRRILYTVATDDLPDWAGGMASFYREHLLKHEYLLPGVGERVREVPVDCVTFDDVLERLPGDKLDLLQIDAEGADGEIIALFPFDRVMPSIVHWEIKNLSRTEQESVLELLGGHGYLVARSGCEDMLAVLPPSAN
ncbi:FkbM family methyltransferase [Microbaculum marinum]|uniref:FkbM family methyltransferase n=1 Tax=Microbaculum marinum TaxID=1764581 RepID=A0AAW9RLM1_9HYPH